LGEQLGDAEVEDLHASRSVQEDVRWLEVAVDDEASVGVLDRLTDRENHPEPLLHAESPSIAVLGDRSPLHALHDDDGTAVRRDPAVEEAGDAGMLQAGQDLALLEKPAFRVNARHAPLQELDGHLLVELAVHTLGQVHDTHTAFAQLTLEPIGADDAA